MTTADFTHLGGLRNVASFKRYLLDHSIPLPCDDYLATGPESPLAKPLMVGSLKLGNRIAIHPMEGWDGTSDGRPTEATFRRWARFGSSGAKLIWGGEAVAVRHDGRANPNQLVINKHSTEDLCQLHDNLIENHREATGATSGLLIGLQLTHSGRYSKPNSQDRPEPRILYHHPVLDRRLGLSKDFPLITDEEIGEIINDYCRAAVVAHECGFDFVDIKHCHGYLGHEFLSAHTREGKYGGSLNNRTRFLREVVEGIRSSAPGLAVGVRLSAFDTLPYKTDENNSSKRSARGVPESFPGLIPYRWGFGVNVDNPSEADLTETFEFLTMLTELGIYLVNISAGSPYYNPHVQRPALYPPSDGYFPPEDPLVGVFRQIRVAQQIKQRFPQLLVVGTGYSYLQEFLPFVAQAVIRQGWADSIGLGRMVLSYPEMLLDVINGQPLKRKKICRTFSDCTTAPRKNLPSGCYPLDEFYKKSAAGSRLRELKR